MQETVGAINKSKNNLLRATSEVWSGNKHCFFPNVPCYPVSPGPPTLSSLDEYSTVDTQKPYVETGLYFSPDKTFYIILYSLSTTIFIFSSSILGCINPRFRKINWYRDWIELHKQKNHYESSLMTLVQELEFNN